MAEWRHPAWRAGPRFGVVVLAVVLVLPWGSLLAPAEVGHRATAQASPVGQPAGDLRVTGGMVTILDRVDGNLTARAAFLNVVGAVAGSVDAVAGRTEIRGRVAGSVQSAGGMVAVYGRVEGDVRAAGGVVTIVEGASIGGNLEATGASLTIVDGARVDGDVRGLVADVVIEGRVGGDVDLAVGRLTLTEGARIRGDLRYRGGDPAAVSPGAVVGGVTARIAPTEGLPAARLLAWRQAAVPRTALLLLVGALLVLLLPRRTVVVADALRRDPWRAAVVGAGAAIFAPLTIALLAITVVGLPLALGGTALFLGCLYVSQVVVGVAAGRLLLRSRPDDGRRGPALLTMAGGVTALAALRLLPVPHLDLLLAVLTAWLALGVTASVLLGGPSPPAVAGLARPDER